MSDSLRDRILREMVKHSGGWIDNGQVDAHCMCGYRGRLGEHHFKHVADAVIAELSLRHVIDYCERQAVVGWRDVGTADEAMGRNTVAELVLNILEGVTQNE